MLLVAWLRSLRRSRPEPPRRGRTPLPLRVRRLEARRVLNASAVVPLGDPTMHQETEFVTFDGLGGVTVDAGQFANDGLDDLFHVARDADRLVVSLNGERVFSGLADTVTSLTIEGSSDADHLQVDLGPSGLPVGALRFDAQDSAADDTLAIHGTSPDVAHTLLGEGGGRVAAGGTSIDYNGVELLRDAVATATRELRLDGADAVSLSSGHDGLLLATDGQQILFGHSQHLAINLDGDGTSRIDVAGLGEFHSDVSIFGDQNDTVRLNGSSDLGRGDLFVVAGTIDVDGSIHSDGGALRLTASSQLTVGVDGLLDSDGGFVSLNAGPHGSLTLTGTVDVSDDDGIGGEARLLGRDVRLEAGADVHADGRLGGGTILVGGDYQGANAAVLNALRTTVAHDVTLSADALDAGDGGRIIIWAEGTTRFAGAVFARGGTGGGDGGFAEVSGKEALAFLGTADLSATQGQGGTLLLDPRTITIVASDPDLNGDGTVGDDLEDPGDLADEDSQGSDTDSIITAGAVEAILAGGQSLVLAASDRIDVEAAITVETGTAGLTLIADLVSIDAAVSIGGTFEVRGDNIHINAAIATPGEVVLTTHTDGGEIHLGGEDVPGAGGVGEVLGISQSELDNIDAAVLQIGSTATGIIWLTDDVVSPAPVLKLVSGGAIVAELPVLPNDVLPTITATSLVTIAGVNVRLDGANHVDSLAGHVIPLGGTFEFVNTGDLTVTSVGGVDGILANAAITIETGGDLSIGQNVDSTGHAITLSAGSAGTIQLADSAVIAGGTGAEGITILRGTLAGDGTVTGDLTIVAGASLAPGSSPGTLTVDGNLTLADGSLSIFEIDDDRTNPPDAPLAGTDYDHVVVTGNTTIESGAGLQLDPSGSTAIDAGDVYTLIHTAGTLSGTFDGFPHGLELTDFGGAGVDAVVGYAAGNFVVQVVGPIVFTAPDDDSANDLRIVRNDLVVEFYVDGVLTGSSLLAAADSITVVGSSSEDESLTVDYSGGVFGVAITFDAGAGGSDSLILSNGSFTTITHTFANANDGRVEMVVGPLTETIVYTGLEPIDDNLLADNRIFVFSDGSETITLTDAPNAGEMTIDSTLGESVTFVNPGSLMTILAGGGDDVIEIHSVDADYRASLTIDGGAGNDSVLLGAALLLGDAVSAGHLDVTAEQISLGANLATNGGASAGNVTLDGAVTLLADVSIDTSAVGTDGTITITSSLNADLESNNRTLTVVAGDGNVAFQGEIGGTDRLAALTIASAGDVSFSSLVSVTGNLTQTAGTGTTTLRGGSIGGGLSLTTNAVAFAAGTTDVTGTATIDAATAIAGGTADGVADLVAASIVLSTTAAVGNVGVGVSGTPLEVATPGVVTVSTAAGDGDVFLTTIGDLNLDRIDAGTGNVTLVATGAVIDARAGDGAGNENILAASATLTAATGIGSTDAIDTAVDTLSAVNTQSGDVRIDEATSVTVTALAQQRVLPGDPIPDGVIVVTAGGVLTVEGTGVLTEGSGGIALTSGSDLIVNAAVQAGADPATDATLGDATDVVLTSGQDLDVNAAVTADGHVMLTATRDVVATATVVAGDSPAATGMLRVDAGRSVALTAAGSLTADGETTILANAGSVALAGSVAAGSTGVVRIVANTTVNQTSGGITGDELGVIAGGDVSLFGPANNVNTFAGTSTGGSLAFADVDGFTLASVASNPDFAGVVGAVASDGDVSLLAGNGLLALDADVTASASGTIRLAGDSINQVSGNLSAGSLGVIATGPVTLTSTANDVDTFAASAGGNLTFRDVDGFTVDTVGADTGFAGVSGVAGQNVTLHAETGDLTLVADVAADAGSGIIRLSAEQGAVSQTSGAVTGGALGVRAGAGGVSLTSAANNVGLFAGASEGAITYHDATGFTVGTVSGTLQFAATSGAQSTNGGVTLSAGTGTLELAADVISVAGGTVWLTSGAGITQSAGAIVSEALAVEAAGDVSLLSAGNNVNTFAAVNNGANAGVAYRDADLLTVGTVPGPNQGPGIAGISTDNGDVLLVTGLGGVSGDGDLLIADAISAGSGTVRLNADGVVIQFFGAPITAGALGVRAVGDLFLHDDENDVATFAATTNGIVELRVQGDLTIGTVTAVSGLFAATSGITTGGGDVLLETGIDAPAGNGALSIDANIDAGAGVVRIAADGPVSQTATIVGSALGIRTTGGAIELLAANDVDVFAADSAGGAVQFADVDGLTIGTVSGRFGDEVAFFPPTVGIVTAGGNVAVVAESLDIEETISSSGGSILLQADDLAIQADVDATNTGLVQITPRTDGRALTLGGAGGLSLNETELNFITAELLAIGGIGVAVADGAAAASAGRITIAGTLAPANIGNLSFLTAADVFGTAAGSIAVPGVIVFDVGTGVTGNGGSDGTFLAVSASGIAGRVNGTGEFRVSSAGDTVVGLPVTLDPIAIAGSTAGFDGITTQNGTIALEAEGGSLTVVADLAVQGPNADLILQAVGATSDLILNANVTSERSVLMLATRDITQASDDHFVIAPGVRLAAGRNIGSALAPIDLQADTVAALSFFGNVFLNQDAGGGDLTIGAVGDVTGVAAGGAVVVTTEAGDLDVAAPVFAVGSVELVSSSALNSTTAGTITGNAVTLTATGPISLAGTVVSSGNTTIHSSASRVDLAGATVGGQLDVDADGGRIRVDGHVDATGLITFDAAAGINVTAGGSLSGSNAIELNAVGPIILGGPVSAASLLSAVSSGSHIVVAAPATSGGAMILNAQAGNVSASAAVTAGGLLDIDADGSVTVTPAGSLAGNGIDLRANGLISLSGSVNSNSHASIVSAADGITIAAVAHANGNLVATAQGGSIVVSAAVSAGGVLDFDAAGSLTTTAAGSLTGNVVDLHANGPISLAGTVVSSGNTTIHSSASRVDLAGATVGGQLDVDADGGRIRVDGHVDATGLITFDAAAGINVTAGGSLSGSNAIELNAVGPIILGGPVSAASLLSVVSSNGSLTTTAAGSLTANVVDLHADGPVSLSGPVNSNNHTSIVSAAGGITVRTAAVSGGPIVVSAAGGIDLATIGSLVATNIVLTAGGPISLNGTVVSGDTISAVATGGGVGITGSFNAGGNVVVTAGAGPVTVSGNVVVLGAIDVDASRGIVVSQAGSVAAATVDLRAGTGALLNGDVTSGSRLDVVTDAGSINISSRLLAANSLTLAAPSGPVVLNAAGQLLSRHVDVDAGGSVLLAGRTAAIVDLVVSSTLQTVIGGPTSAGNSINIGSGGNLVVSAAVSSGGLVNLQSLAVMNVTSAGSIGAGTIQMLGTGSVLIGGRLDATFNTSVVSAGGGVLVDAPVSTGQNMSMLAGNGNVMLGHNLAAGQTVILQSPNGSVLQPSSAWTVAGQSAVFVAGGSVGQTGEAIDLAVNRVAATAVHGGAWLNQDASAGTLTVAILGTERGVRSTQPVGISTENGDLVLAAPVMGSTIDLIANRAAGSPDPGRVLFDRGYAETPTGRIVASPPQNIPVDEAGNPITRFELASPFIVTFGIIAGNIADTVDGTLGDRGVTVSVDFVQPPIFDPSQNRFQSITDATGAMVADRFGPFSFQYSELFLQAQLILGGAREQLFNIVITASQDDSISIAEQLDGTTIVDPTQQTVRFGDVSTSPTEQSLSVPLGIVSPVFAGIDIPQIVEADVPVTPDEPPVFVAPAPSLPLVVGGVESTGASAGASSADRPRLFLVWERPDESGETATIEIDLIWFARDYQRQLIGYLKEGRYWFELAEPGSPARQLGDSFYVRNGLVIDDPAAAGSEAVEPPQVTPDVPDVPPPLAPPEAGRDPADDDRADRPSGDSTAAVIGSQSAAAVVGGLLYRRWRGRLTAARNEDRQEAPLGKPARRTRQLRRAAQADWVGSGATGFVQDTRDTATRGTANAEETG